MHPLFLVILVMVAQVSPTVAVSTDRAWYSPGEQVTIHVSTTGFASSERLWFYVDKPDGHNLYFTELSSRGGTIVLKLSEDASDGSYMVTVTWDHHYIQTGFIVQSQPIPEFPFPLAVLLVAFTIAFATLSRRKTSTSAKTATSHPRAYIVC